MQGTMSLTCAFGILSAPFHSNLAKDTLLSQAAATRAKMTRALTAPTKDIVPVTTSTSEDAGTAAIADAVAAGTLSTTAAAPLSKKANAIVVSMSTNTIPLEVRKSVH